MGKGGGNTVQAFWIGLGTMGQILLSLVTAMVLSRYFNKVDYGTYKQVLFIYSSLLVAFNAGLPKVYAYYLPKYSKAKGKSIVKKVNALLFVSGFLFSIVLYFGAPLFANVLKNDALKEGVRIFSIVPLLILPTLGIKGIFTSYKQTQYIAIYIALTKLLMLICIISPVIFWENSLQSALYGWIIASGLSLILALFLQTIPFKGIKSEQAELPTKTILKYSIPIVYASIAGIAIKAADQFYISRYFGPEVYAEFSNGFMNLPIVGFITSAASLVLMPVFSKMLVNKENVGDLIVLWNKTLYKSALLIFPITFFFIFFAKPIVLILFGNEYENSILYFQIASGLNFFRIIVFSPLILALGEVRIYALVHVLFAILAWILGFLILQIVESPFAIVSVSVFNAIALILTILTFSSKALSVKVYEMIPFKMVLKIFIHALITISMTYYCFNNFFLLENKIALVTLSFICYSSILYLSSIFLNIDYLLALRPMLKKVRGILQR